MSRFLFLALVGLFTSYSFADDLQIKQALAPFGVAEAQISDSPIAGLKTVVTNQGVFYASEDGKYFIQGSMIKMTDKGPIDISYLSLMEKLNGFAPKMIIYPAQDPKYTVTVFTDFTCPYCHLLHKDLEDYNKLGITVRYMAFPRSGPDSKTGKEMESIWTSKDPKANFTAAIEGVLPAGKTADIVKQEYSLGLAFGVNGTPAIITENGQVIPGYLKPEQLLQILQQSSHN